ncbi:unnamed protein product [marine sediment metagenome]|uniref:Uncharacterized protein n=1 Tax=marine sediment metagenome TaxID=412755 RepID=X0TFD0_9ZZZZ
MAKKKRKAVKKTTGSKPTPEEIAEINISTSPEAEAPKKSKDSPEMEVAKKKAAAIIEAAKKGDKNQVELNEAFKNEKATVFISRYKEHCLTMLPIVLRPNPVTGANEKISPGKDIQFHRGVYATSDKEEIKWLEARPSFGSVITIAKSSPEEIKKEVAKQLGE